MKNKHLFNFTPNWGARQRKNAAKNALITSGILFFIV
jgi:hypothetical protein